MDSIHTFLENYGLWSLLVLFVAKWLSGVLVSVKDGVFSWHYLADMLKSDGVAFAAYALLVGIGKYSGVPELNNYIVAGGFGATLAATWLAGAIRNFTQLLTNNAAQRLPQSLQ